MSPLTPFELGLFRVGALLLACVIGLGFGILFAVLNKQDQDR